MAFIYHRKVSLYVNPLHNHSPLTSHNRGHTTRFDLPRTLQLESSIPELEVDEKPAVLFAFVSMCKLFQNFGLAMDERAQDGDQGFYVAMHKRLRETQENAQFSSNLQRADFLITQQWMRVVLWKMSLFHIELSASPAEESLSLRLPDQIARNVMGHLNTFPTHIVEAHGLGMVCVTLAVKKTSD